MATVDNMSKRPCLALTMGDPAGIGPEIIVKALARRDVWEFCRPMVIGVQAVFEDTIRDLQSSLRVHVLRGDQPIQDAKAFKPGILPLHDPCPRAIGAIRLGKACAEAGAAAVTCITTAVRLAQSHCVAGIVTAPINKEAMHLAGYSYPGHTELLAALTRSKTFGMMIVGGPLKVLFATTHLAIREVSASLTQTRVNTAIRLAHLAMRQHYHLRNPKIAVAALNPHAGESGLFGNEEQRTIAPAVRRAQRAGLSVRGPFPADTLFVAAARGDYDCIVAMYHDQGLIPLKLLAFGSCVNVTVGIPILRTSVDHGTAFDIAGKNKANPDSLVKAIELAVAFSTGNPRVPVMSRA